MSADSATIEIALARDTFASRALDGTPFQEPGPGPESCAPLPDDTEEADDAGTGDAGSTDAIGADAPIDLGSDADVGGSATNDDVANDERSDVANDDGASADAAPPPDAPEAAGPATAPSEPTSSGPPFRSGDQGCAAPRARPPSVARGGRSSSCSSGRA